MNNTSKVPETVINEIKANLHERLEALDWYVNHLVAEIRTANEKGIPVDRAHESMLHMHLDAFETLADSIKAY